MARYVVTFAEVRDPETGKLVRRGQTLETKTARGEHHADVLTRVGRLQRAPDKKPRGQAATVKPPAHALAHGQDKDNKPKKADKPEAAVESKAEDAPAPVKPLSTEDAEDLAPRSTYSTRRLKAED